jgi:hypothetical protein
VDFSKLSDDQLLQLMKAVLAECINRGVAIATAANRIGSDAVEEMLNKVESSQQNTSIETERSAVITAILKTRYLPTYYIPFGVNIWEKNGDKRAYIQESFNNDGWKITYYHTGNRWNRRGSITSENIDISDCKPQLIQFCNAICDRFESGFKAYSNDAEKYPPNPDSLNAYQQLLQIN